jgi:hypothetical protein
MDQKFHDDDDQGISILRPGPLAQSHNPAKVPKFKYKAWWYSIDQKFHADEKKTFNLLKTEKCAAYFRGNTQFPF